MIMTIAPKDFLQDVLDVFKDFCHNNGFELLDAKEYTVLLKSSRCIIEVSLDEETAVVAFLDLGRRYHFTLGEIIDYLLTHLRHPSMKDIKYLSERQYVKAILTQKIEFIAQNFMNPIRGDFTWVAQYELGRSRTQKLMRKIMTLNPLHHLYKKAMNQEFGWREEADLYFADK
jgi:hypothetical protein